MTTHAPGRALVLLAAVLLAGCERAMTSDSTEPGSVGGRGARFLALGDSYTIGEAVEPSRRWPNQLREVLRRRGVDLGEVHIVARTGWTIEELHAGIDAVGPVGPFERVSVLIGVNNQYRGVPAEAARGELRRLLDRAVGFAGGDAGRVFVVSIPDYGVTPFGIERDPPRIAREIDAYNRLGAEEAGARGIAFIDITPISRQAAADATLIADDGLHPSAAQYRLWAARIATALEKPRGLEGGP
jgi:lysophospholipase L1-like esterase